MVVRGTYGLYYDSPNFNGFFDNRPGNNGAVGVQANNTGPNPVFNVSRTFYQWQTAQVVFPTAPSTSTPQGFATVSPRFHTAYVAELRPQYQYQISRNTLATLAYAGAVGRRLFNLSDINQAAPGTDNSSAGELTRRPIYQNKTVPNYSFMGAVNEIQSEGTSNYHSLQGMIRTSGFHGLTAQGFVYLRSRAGRHLQHARSGPPELLQPWRRLWQRGLRRSPHVQRLRRL